MSTNQSKGKIGDCRVLGQAGQTSVEYILLIAVVVAISVSLFSQIEGYLVDNPDSFLNRYLSAYSEMFNGPSSSFSGQYKYFTIKD